MAYYKAEFEGVVEEAFACAECGYEGRGTITAKGNSTGGTAAQAQESAKVVAERDAREVVAITPCPSCGKRNAAAAEKYRKGTVLQTVIFLAFAGVAAVVMAFVESRLPLFIAAGLAIAAIAGVFTLGRAFDEARHRVRFEDGEKKPKKKKKKAKAALDEARADGG